MTRIEQGYLYAFLNIMPQNFSAVDYEVDKKLSSHLSR